MLKNLNFLTLASEVPGARKIEIDTTVLGRIQLAYFGFDVSSEHRS